MFDKEEWTVVADDTPDVLLGVVSNVVFVNPVYGKAYNVCIRVPSAFFPYMRDVLNVDPETAREHPAMLYLEQLETRWYFGVAYGKHRDTMDLWIYKDLPVWANRGRCL